MMIKIVRWLGALLAAALLGLVAVRVNDIRRVKRITESLETQPSEERFTADMVAELPEPTRRYFLHEIRSGTPLASSVCVDMCGTIQLSPRGEWLPLEAREILAVPRGFVWAATAARALMRMSGTDHYLAGSGRVRFWLWELLPVVDRTGPDITRSSRGRLAAEAFLLPSSLLPRRGVKWETLDEASARATFEIDGETVALTLWVDPDGRLRQCCLSRWGDQTADGSWGSIPFGGEFVEEHAFGGYTIPTRLSAGWSFGTDRYTETFRAEITDATFR